MTNLGPDNPAHGFSASERPATYSMQNKSKQFNKPRGFLQFLPFLCDPFVIPISFFKRTGKCKKKKKKKSTDYRHSGFLFTALVRVVQVLKLLLAVENEQVCRFQGAKA